MSDLISSDLSEDMKNSWGTDQRVFDAINHEFMFDLDAAASNKNSLVGYDDGLYLTKEDNALTVDWSSLETPYPDSGSFIKTAWVNPPYSRGMIKKFMDKCVEQKEKGVTSVMLVPNALESGWLPINEISEIRIITGGRLTFIHPETGKPVAGNTRGSMFVIFRPSSSPCFVRLVDRDYLLSCGNT